MTPKQAIKHWGNQSSLAKSLQVSRQVVNNWYKRDRIPLVRQLDIEYLTRGILKVDRPRKNGGAR